MAFGLAPDTVDPRGPKTGARWWSTASPASGLISSSWSVLSCLPRRG